MKSKEVVFVHDISYLCIPFRSVRMMAYTAWWPLSLGVSSSYDGVVGRAPHL